MKKILLASTVLVAGAVAAHAEAPTLSGNARIGVVSTDGDLAYTNRVRASVSMSGSSDGGLSFGGSFGIHDAVGAAAGTAGSVYVSGAFGKLSLGDVDSAAKAATGNVAGVGLTGLGDLNESTFVGKGAGANALYEYAAGSFTGYFSASNPGANADLVYALGAKYATDAFTVGAGYEDNKVTGTKHTVLKASTSLGGASLQALYGKASGAVDGTQYALSAGYTVSGVAVTAFYTDDSKIGGAKAYGLGGSYDLGGGASLSGGVAQNKTAGTTNYDLGVAFTF